MKPPLRGYGRDDREEVEQLTQAMARALDEVVLQAETRDLLEGVARVGGRAAVDGLNQDPVRLHERTHALLTAYRLLSDRDPDRARGIVRAARDYARVLAHLGVRDPWSHEVPRVRASRALLAATKLILTAPLALLGAVLWWVPYRLAGRVAPRITRGEEDLLGTVKILTGCAFIAATWIAEMVVAGLIWGWPGAAAVTVLGPAGGYAAMRFEELTADTAEASRQGPGADGVADRRRALADDVSRAFDRERDPQSVPHPPR